MSPYPTPIADARLDALDAATWDKAMQAYHHARSMGLSRPEAFAALEPLLQHPRLATAAKIMQDISRHG